MNSFIISIIIPNNITARRKYSYGYFKQLKKKLLLGVAIYAKLINKD